MDLTGGLLPTPTKLTDLTDLTVLSEPGLMQLTVRQLVLPTSPNAERPHQQLHQATAPINMHPPPEGATAVVEAFRYENGCSGVQ